MTDWSWACLVIVSALIGSGLLATDASAQSGHRRSHHLRGQRRPTSRPARGCARGQGQRHVLEPLSEECRQIRRSAVRRRQPRQDGIGLDQDMSGHTWIASEGGGGRPMRFVPAGEARNDHARVDRDHRRVRSIASLTNSSVSGGSLPSGTATGPAPRRAAPRQRHGQGRWFDFDPPIPLPDVDDPPRLEAEASQERFGDDHTPGRVDGSSHVKIMPSFVTGSFERVRSEMARG